MVGAVVLALLPACGSGSGENGGGSAGDAGGEPTTLRVALSVDVGGAQDPHTFTGNFTLLDMVYEPLVIYGEGGVIEPGLAESFEVSDDGLRVTFRLRDGVTFHDGTPFDAEAVKWNFDRWVGKEDYSFFRTANVISQVNVVDPATVELVLTEPYPPLLQELSIVRPVRFLSPASVGPDASTASRPSSPAPAGGPDGAFAEPVGTGPWRLESSSETGAVLVRYDGYWGEQSSIDRVEFKVIPDSQTRVSALRSGEVDLIGGAYLAPVTPVEAQQLESADGIKLLVGDPDTTVVVGFNPRGPLADRAVRAAVARTIDRKALTAALYPGFGQPADTLFPPSIPDSGEPIGVRFDPDAARAALDGAGWVVSGDGRAKSGKPLELELLVPLSPVHGVQDSRTAAAAVAAALEQVGIGVTVKAVDEAAYYDEFSARSWDLSFVETYGAPYDPSNSAVSYLTSEGSDSPLWATPELDGLVDAAVFAATDAARAAACQNVFDYLEDQAAFVPLTRPSRLWAVGPGVSGFEVPITEYDMDLRSVTVSR